MLIQIKIMFSFMVHIINMRKGYLWDCLLQVNIQELAIEFGR